MSAEGRGKLMRLIIIIIIILDFERNAFVLVVKASRLERERIEKES
jgi:hypothetical protein